MTLLFITVFFYILLFVVFISLFYSTVRYVPFVPTEKKVMEKMIEAAPVKNWKPLKTIQTRKEKPKNFLIYVYQIT